MERMFDTHLGTPSKTNCCLTRDSMILMADGTEKPVQEIARGDLVAGNKDGTIINIVARLNTNILPPKYSPDVVVFEPDSLGPNLPSDQLIITANHPLLWNGKRRPAHCFANLPNITRYYKGQIFKQGIQFNDKIIGNIGIKDLISIDPDGQYKVYDLQFEQLGSYIAEGVELQSRSPRSNITPLPIELYFDQSMYRQDLSENDEEYELKLDLTEITSL